MKWSPFPCRKVEKSTKSHSADPTPKFVQYGSPECSKIFLFHMHFENSAVQFGAKSAAEVATLFLGPIILGAKVKKKIFRTLWASVVQGSMGKIYRFQNINLVHLFSENRPYQRNSCQITVYLKHKE